MRDGAIPRVALAASLLAAFALAVAGCGGGGGREASEAEAQAAADVEILNTAISRELATAAAYRRGLRLRGERGAALLRELRAQALEHVNALTKAIRGLGGELDLRRAEPPALTGVRDRAGFLAFAYQLESSGVAAGLNEIADLAAPWPRSLLGSIAANQAEHLVLLRQALGGVGPREAAPGAFESGDAPPPAS